MSETNGDDLADPADVKHIIDLRLFEALKKELHGSTKEKLALRKALLLLIAMSVDDLGEPGRRYIDWLLTEFAPLADSFSKEHTHDFIGENFIARVLEHKGEHLTVVVPKSLLDDLMKDLLDK
ncbi:MAG: hypothetical protein JWP89_2613 [Schlesneria sp.]|nr:hypothetical protein [Schlesneria sp.]